MIWEEEWWHRMSGPQRLIEATASLLQENGTVLLRVPEDLSWRHGLRAAMEEKIREWNGGGLIVEELDVQDSCPDAATEIDAGYAVINALNPGASSGYRPGSGPIAQYISSGQADLFTDRLLWVKGFHTEAACKAFSTLCKHCRRGKAKILLEDSTGWCSPGAGLRAAEFADHVSPFDIQLLCMIAANEIHNGLPQPWREYIALLGANLCGMDAELATAMICDHDLRAEEPMEVLRRLCDSASFERRGAASGHVLYHLRHDDDGGAGFVDHMVWKAQIQVGLPMVEQAMSGVRCRLHDELTRVLDQEEVFQYHERVIEADDVEAGTLTYLMHSGRLLVSDRELRDRIYCIRDNRNRMAHHIICSIEQMNDVFLLGEQ